MDKILAPGSRPLPVVKAGLCLLALAAAYALFAGTLGIDEALAALPAVAAAGWFAGLTHRAAKVAFGLTLPWRLLPRLAAALALDSWRVGRVLLVSLVRPGTGSIVRQKFRHGGPDAADAGRRATVILAASLAPNGYVLRAPRHGEFLLLHRLAPAPMKTDEEWPA